MAAATQPAFQIQEMEAAEFGESAGAHPYDVRWSRGVQRNVQSGQRGGEHSFGYGFAFPTVSNSKLATTCT